MTPVVVTLPLRLISTLNAREHWSVRAQRTAEQRFVTRATLSSLDVRSLGLPVRATITRVAPRPLDGDNLQGSCKATRDGVADALGVDDRDPRVEWVYMQQRGRPREYGVEIRIERLQQGTEQRVYPEVSSAKRTRDERRTA